MMITGLGRGGAETQLQHVALGLRDRGHEVAVVSMIRGGPVADSLEASGLTPDTFDLSRVRPSRWIHVSRALRRFAPDVLCAFLFHATLGAVALRLPSGARRVVSSIRDPNYGSAARLRLVSALVRSGAIDSVVANSATIAQRLTYSLPSRRTHVVYNAIDTDRWAQPKRSRAALRSELSVGDDEFMWLAVGNLMPEKDYPSLLRAVHSLPNKSRLFIAGRGDPSSEMRELSGSSNGRIRMLGPRDDVCDLLHAADGYVLSSRSEGMPNALMEASAAGKLAVATDVGGVREVLPNPDFIVPPQDPRALAAAMARATGLSAAERLAAGMVARRHVERAFAVSPVLDQWEEVLSGDRPPS